MAMKTSRKQANEFIKRHLLKAAFLVILFAVVSLLFGTSLKFLLLVSFLVLLASFSTFYFNYVNAPINFELVKLMTILVGYTHGIVPGILVGVVSTLLGKVLIGRIDEKLPISVAAISLVAIGASVFSGVSITALGILLVGFYNVSLLAISIALGGDFGWNLPYEGSNFAINFILFTRIAPLLVPMLS